jgi:hypothetical protein
VDGPFTATGWPTGQNVNVVQGMLVGMIFARRELHPIASAKQWREYFGLWRLWLINQFRHLFVLADHTIYYPFFSTAYSPSVCQSK